VQYKKAKKMIKEAKAICKKNERFCERVAIAIEEILKDVSHTQDDDDDDKDVKPNDVKDEEYNAGQKRLPINHDATQKEVEKEVKNLDDNETFIIFPFPIEKEDFISLSHGMTECDGRLQKNTPSIFPSDQIIPNTKYPEKSSLNGEDIKRLLPRRWVNDHIIEFWSTW
jgi:Ulp1 family protease